MGQQSGGFCSAYLLKRFMDESVNCCVRFRKGDVNINLARLSGLDGRIYLLST